MYFPVLIGGGFALWRWRGARFAVIVPLMLLIAHIASTPWLRTHYLAPIVPLWIMFVVYAIRGTALVRLPNTMRWRPPRELAISVALALIIGSTVFALHTNILAAIVRREAGDGRAEILDALQRVPGRHIVFVYYTPGPQNEYEWVTNGADLVDAPVLWVHMRTDHEDMQMVNQYPDRNVWMLTVDNEHFNLRPVVMRSEVESATPAAP